MNSLLVKGYFAGWCLASDMDISLVSIIVAINGSWIMG
jgi:hypothetical protein